MITGTTLLSTIACSTSSCPPVCGLRLCRFCSACEKIEFTVLRDKVHATDGNLTAHCKKLENAGYLTVEKLFVNRKPLTLYSATPLGREAVKKYAQQLASSITIKLQ